MIPWRRIARLWRIVYVLVVGSTLAWVVVRAVRLDADFIRSLASVRALVFAAGWIAMACALGLLWRAFVSRRYGVVLGTGEALQLQSRAWLGRYLPGKIGVLLGKMEVVQTHGLPARRVAASVFFEQAAFVASGLIVAALLLGRPLEWPWALPDALASLDWTVLRTLMGLVGLVAFLSLPFLVRALEGNAGADGRIPLGAMLGGYTLTHVLVGAGAIPLVSTLLPGGADALGPWGIAGVIALAHVAGIFAVFAPAGLGVRELVFAAAFAGTEAAATAIAAAASIRLLTLLADGLFLLPALWIRRREPS